MSETLEQLISRRPVVVFRSRLTDVRAVRTRLRDLDIDFEEIDMPMGDAAMRARFDALKQRTDWEMLPQIFVEGKFVGGADELLQHPLLARPSGSRRAWWPRMLGYAGVVPFAAGLLAMHLATDEQALTHAARAMLAYGAVILSFIGAVHWGSAMRGTGRMPSVVYLVSVLPALLGWLTTVTPLVAGFALQLLTLLGVYAYERLAAEELSFPGWYRRLRGHLSFAVGALLAGALVLAASA